MKRKIRNIAVSVLGAAFFIGAFSVCSIIETETMMPTKYTTVATVIENEYINRNNFVITVEVDGEAYKYYADAPEKLLSKVTVEMHSKGTLKKNDDEVIDAY